MKMRIKNSIYKLVYAIIIATITVVNFAFASNNISNIDIDVVIRDNGSALITQTWGGSFDEGTELYLPIEDKSLIVRDLRVWKNGREYQSTDRWNPSADFQNKKWRSGIYKTDKGVELCFGITEYGENVYRFSYTIDPLVKAYKDYDGFNFQFVNPYMATFPTNSTVKIQLENGRELTYDNTQIWGFGFEGNAFISEGYAVAFNTIELNGSNHINLVLRFQKGLLSPNVDIKEEYEAAVLDEALEGRDFKEQYYDYTTNGMKKKGFDWKVIRLFLFALLFFIPIALIIAYTIIERIKLKQYYKNCNYFRDVPNNGNIAISHVLAVDFSLWSQKEANIVGALIMKMINDKNLVPIKEQSYGLFGKEKVTTSLKIGSEPTDEITKKLFDIIVKAASSDMILQENELKSFAEQNQAYFNEFLDYVKKCGRSGLNKKKAYVRTASKYFGDLTEVGRKELGEVYGLRKFLEEFTLINERSSVEGIVWEDLLVYATLFGLADKVLKELKNMYPDRIAEIDNYSRTIYISNAYFRSLNYGIAANRSTRDLTMAARGFGGVTSIGGGGGFSGGGMGGGTR